MLKTGLCIVLFALAAGCAPKQKPFTDYVNPLLGTATLWDSVDLGFKPTKRTWGAEVFPGSSLPNAMVQVSPVTKFHSGAGYQYEDSVIYGFTHTNKGHWNLCHIPLLPVTGTPLPGDYCSPYSHARESAAPGYYRVFLDRYGVDAELTSTLRCAFHKYTYPAGAQAALLADLQRSNEHVRAWDIRKEGDNAFAGWQQTGEKMYFYAVADRPVTGIEPVAEGDREIRIVRFGDGDGPVELRIGFSFVSEENARKNLEAEMLGRSFADVRSEATAVWNDLLGRIRVEGGTEREKGLFYSSLYRSFLWPALRSDVNGEFTDADGEVVNTGFRYYTGPSYWDDYRNKLILLGLLAPDVAADVISSDTDRGEKRGGFMPTFFHGDHASAFVAGVYLRGIRGFDVRRAYELVLRNATVQGPIRPWLDEYVARGYIPEMDVENPVTQTVCKAAVTKTLEYAYDDYAVALLADVLGDGANRDMLMKRTSNYKNLFDPSTGLMRGRLDDGSWITPFDDQYPYYEYMYREANAWQQAFFAPHDTEGLIGLYPSRERSGRSWTSSSRFRGRATRWTTFRVLSGSTATATSPTTVSLTCITSSAVRSVRRSCSTTFWTGSTAWDPKDWRCRAWTTPARCRRGMSSTPSGFTPIPRPIPNISSPCRCSTRSQCRWATVPTGRSAARERAAGLRASRAAEIRSVVGSCPTMRWAKANW